MKILVAEDDRVSRLLLETHLKRWRTTVRPLYIILLTARADRQDAIDGLGAGTDDFVTKPFDAAELRARVSVGVRVVELQEERQRFLAAGGGIRERPFRRPLQPRGCARSA